MFGTYTQRERHGTDPPVDAGGGSVGCNRAELICGRTEESFGYIDSEKGNEVKGRFVQVDNWRRGGGFSRSRSQSEDFFTRERCALHG